MNSKKLFVFGLLLTSQVAFADQVTQPSTSIDTIKAKAAAVATKVVNVLKKPMTIATIAAITAAGAALRIQAHRRGQRTSLVLALENDNHLGALCLIAEGAALTPSEATSILENSLRAKASRSRFSVETAQEKKFSAATAQILINQGATISQNSLTDAILIADSKLFITLCNHAPIKPMGSTFSGIKADELLRAIPKDEFRKHGFTIQQMEELIQMRAYIVDNYSALSKKAN